MSALSDHKPTGARCHHCDHTKAMADAIENLKVEVYRLKERVYQIESRAMPCK